MFPGSHRLHSCFLWHIFVIFKQPHESHPHRKQSTFIGSLPTRRLYQRESCGSKGNQYNTNSEARDSNTQCESARWWRDSKKSGFSFPCCKPKIERSSFCHRLTLRLWWSSQLHPLCHTLLLYTETAVSSSHTLSNFLQMEHSTSVRQDKIWGFTVHAVYFYALSGKTKTSQIPPELQWALDRKTWN